MITEALLMKALRIQYPMAKEWAQSIASACAIKHIEDADQQAMFLAQIAHESGLFSFKRENMNYSSAGILKVFPTHVKADEVNKFARQPTLLANRVYANRNGNGPEESGDGWKYRGGGLLQLTGRANYKACGEALGVDLENDPSHIEEPLCSALSAAWFWNKNGCNRHNDMTSITKIINGGLNHLQERVDLYNQIKKAMGDMYGTA